MTNETKGSVTITKVFVTNKIDKSNKKTKYHLLVRRIGTGLVMSEWSIRWIT